MRLQQIQKILSQNNKTLKKNFSVKSLYLFGSTVRGEARKNSDLDLIVEFSSEVGLFKFIQLKNFLEKILKSKVDLVTSDAIVAWLQDSIKKEKVRVA